MDNILYVEDHAGLRQLFATVLRSAGYNVQVAEDGQLGWEALQAGGYDLLITDNEMPRLSGLELVKRIRAAGHRVPVIVASASFSAEEAQRQHWLQVTAILRKPFTPQQLVDTVDGVLRAGRGQLGILPLAKSLPQLEPIRGWGINE